MSFLKRRPSILRRPTISSSPNLLVRERKSDEAIAALHKAVALDPSDPWIY